MGKQERMMVGRESIELVSGCEYFDADWYLARYRDVRLLRMDPAEHYLRLGARIGRSPGPRFDGPRYLAENTDVAAAGDVPLLHYLRLGRSEGRLAYALDRAPIADPKAYLHGLADARVEGQPQRMFAAYDTDLEQDFLECVARMPASSSSSSPSVSVVMPAYNREASVARAIDSVRAQTHASWELLVVDDGSSDRTIPIVESYASDPRIRLFRQQHQGVSAARNTGLEHARGEWIFYLDSDNRWTPGFIANMLRYLQAVGRECGYSGIAVEDDDETITGYRGEPFDWDACLRGNYVDLNAFCHTRTLYERLGGFDESLRRMVDWDLILRFTKHSMPAYAPFLGCRYLDSKRDQARISVAQPIAYRSVVQTKNTLDAPSPMEIANSLSLTIAIKIAAPFEKRAEWGDFHYAESLKAALEKLGHRVVIDFLGGWYERQAAQESVVIVLRGLTAYEPRPGRINILWNISHPDQVSYEEYNAYDVVYVASLSYPLLLSEILGRPVFSLLQCTDTDRFHPESAGIPESGDLLFVGNSRNEFRKIVRWAVDSGSDLRVYGSRWEGFIDPSYIHGHNVDNRELTQLYGSAHAVLNDHWDSMRDFGFISNRVFDVLAAGGKLISDPIPSLDTLFPGEVAQVSSQEAFAAAVASLSRDDVGRAGALDRAQKVADLHSFDARAQRICNDILERLSLPHVHRSDIYVEKQVAAVGQKRRKRVGLIMQPGRVGPTSSGYIRLLCPLSSEAAFSHIEVRVLQGPDDPSLKECDVCIVQRVAISDIDQARALVRTLEDDGKPLFVDNDDAFCVMSADHPEVHVYQEKDAALRHLMSHASRVWFSTQPLLEAYQADARHPEVLANNLDPRLWRDYRKPSRKLFTADCLQLLYMGTATHDGDFAMIFPALERLHRDYPQQFMLTIVGALRNVPTRPWLKVLTPPNGDYPRFVRWLDRQGPFDVGLAPLVSDAFNDCKSDIKFLDYTALGLVSLLSDVPAYSGPAKDRDLAIHVFNSEDGWFSSLEAVLARKFNLDELASKAAKYVWSERVAAGGAAMTGLSEAVCADP